MSWHAATGLLIAVLGLSPAAAHAAAAPTVRYAGIVTSFDGKVLVLDDVGRGQAGRQEVSITSRTVAVTPRTALYVAIRVEDAQSGFAGDYRETRAEIADLEVGAFVTVRCQPEGARCRALKLIIVRTGRSESARQVFSPGARATRRARPRGSAARG